MPNRRLRPGEVAVELPAAYDAGIYFLGRIRTPWARREDCPKNSGEFKATCTIEIDARYAEALRDIETVSHLIVLYFMDEAARDILLQAPNHYKKPHGAFALRSPARPNPIAHSVVRLLKLRARGSRSSASIAVTARRWSISNLTSPRSMPSPTRRSDGTRRNRRKAYRRALAVLKSCLIYERFRAVLRFVPRPFASNFVTLLRAANAAFFKALRFMTTDVVAPAISAPAIAGMRAFRMLILRARQDGVSTTRERHIKPTSSAEGCSDANAERMPNELWRIDAPRTQKRGAARPRPPEPPVVQVPEPRKLRAH